MENEMNNSIRINHISIKNYKCIDSFEMEFPLPDMVDDMDIFAFGSANGLGKSSIIECCALVFLCFEFKKNTTFLIDNRLSADITNLIIRHGTDSAEILGEVTENDRKIKIKLKIERNGNLTIEHDMQTQQKNESDYKVIYKEKFADFESRIMEVCGFFENPVIRNNFLLFHSYRKMSGVNPEPGMAVSDPRTFDQGNSGSFIDPSLSNFKLVVLWLLLKNSDLYEFSKDSGSVEAMEKLIKLIETFIGGKSVKIRQSVNNTADFRIISENVSGSFSFDGLSSGQKEIITTLFLIWYHTRDKPSVVFVDEPELHLNPQWHRKFKRQLLELAPDNQYVIATNSVDVMDSIDRERRILLLGDKNGNF